MHVWDGELARNLSSEPVSSWDGSVMAKYLITGVAGFIGSALAEALLERGEDVRGIDNLSTGKRSNIEPFLKRMEFREADLRDAAAMREACDGVEIIFHEGALPSVPRSVKDPATSHDSNINGTFNLLEAARATGVRRIIYAASSSAYGNQPGMPRRESMTPAPIAPYPVQKLAGELYMKSYWQVYGMETACLRYFNIFGPRQTPDSPYSGVMAKFILQMMRGETPTIFGTGEQGRDFTYVANAVSANLLAAVAPKEKIGGRTFNVACGGRHTLNETYGILAALLSFRHAPEYGPPRLGDITDSEADISAANEAFGYEPVVGFEEGLKRTVDWYRENFDRQV
jgi:nucleoside-diphosphate-sugar epimerase